MIPHAVQITIPVWAQVILVTTAVLSNLATGLFVLFVLWPSIRNQERRAVRLERWIDGPDGRRIGKAVLDKIAKGDGLEGAGPIVDKKDWERTADSGGEDRTGEL